MVGKNKGQITAECKSLQKCRFVITVQLIRKYKGTEELAHQ